MGGLRQDDDSDEEEGVDEDEDDDDENIDQDDEDEESDHNFWTGETLREDRAVTPELNWYFFADKLFYRNENHKLSKNSSIHMVFQSIA